MNDKLNGKSLLDGNRLLLTPMQQQAIKLVEDVMQRGVPAMQVLMQITRPPAPKELSELFMHMLHAAWLDNQIFMLREQMRQAGINNENNKPIN